MKTGCRSAVVAPLLMLGIWTAPALAEPSSAAPPAEDEIIDTKTRVLATSRLTDLESLVEELRDRRVIYLGESHDRYEDHLNQLAIIAGLHSRGVRLAIGLEAFQQPFQRVLDDYVAGIIDEPAMLRQTGYFERWRFDYRLYRPILRFAQQNRIPLVALNLEREITEKVATGGVASLSETERARLPTEIDREDPAYEARLRAVFAEHPQREGASFERFLEVQLLWDEGMAERIVRYVTDHPDQTLVVLAGVGHLEFGQGIPKRVARRLQVPAAIVLNGNQREPLPSLADYLLYPRRVELPAAGLLGVLLDLESAGEGVAIRGFSDPSGAKAAGMETGDRLVRIGDQAIESYSDIRIALMDRRPGQRIPVEVRRIPRLGQAKRLTFEVLLH